MDEVLTAKELANKRKGQIAGGIMFLLLIILSDGRSNGG